VRRALLRQVLRLGLGLGLALPLAPSLALGVGLAGCDSFGSSKVAQGQRYTSGDSRYDPYFASVHQQQVAAEAWPDEKKAARRPLVGALALTPGASEDTMLDATRERVRKSGKGATLDVSVPRVTPQGTDGTLYAAVEETARLQLELARKMKATSERLEEMARHGEGLKKEADKEFENRGAQKADEKQTEKHREIRRELGGSIEALRSLAKEATAAAKDVDELLEDLGGALEAKDTPRRTRRSAPEGKRHVATPPAKPEPPPSRTEPTAKPEPPARTDEPKPKPKPPSAPAHKPEAKPPRAPDPPPEPPKNPTPKPPDEVFNP